MTKQWLIIRPKGFPISFHLDRRVPVILLVLTLVTLLAMVLSVGYGEYPISPVDVVKTLLGIPTANGDYAFIINTLRLPRTIVAFLVGVGLAIAGTITQGITRNPLAAPGIIGVNAGATLAAVSLIILLPNAPVSLLPLAAFGGALAIAILIYLLAWQGGSSPVRLILVGIGFSLIASALTDIMITFGEINTVSQALVWLAGSVYRRTWSQVMTLLPWIAIFGLVALLLTRELNTLSVWIADSNFILNLMDRSINNISSSHPVTPSPSHNLEAKQLTLAYDGAAIVRNLDLAIPAGKTTVLVGANGCGKSTLLRGLTRLLKPKSGQVYLDGKAITKLKAKTVAQKMGMLPQSPVAPEGLSVKDLVSMGRYPYQSWMQQWSTDDEKQVAEALSITTMTELADRPLDSLFGGQRQRAWIAMVLAQDTDILLLDEPTTFLDLSHQVDLLDLLDELQSSKGKTIVMILHDLNLSCRYADYLVAVQQGKVHATGTPQEVMTEEMVRDVFNLECRIVPDPLSDTPMCIPMRRKTRRHSIQEEQLPNRTRN